MSCSVSSSKPPDLTKDVMDLAEILGVILVAKLNETIRVAITSEANMWRTDALQILSEFRKDIHSRFGDSGVERGADQSIAPTNVGAHLSLLWANKSSGSSCSTPPTTVFGKGSSSEQRLAAKFAAINGSLAKSATGREISVPRGDSSFGQPLDSSHSQASVLHFDSLIPSEGANHVRSGVTVENHEATPTSSESPHNVYDRWVVGTCSSLTTQESTALQMDCACGGPSALEPICSEQSAQIQAPEVYQSEGENVDWWSSVRSLSSTETIAERWQIEATTFFHQRSTLPRDVAGLSGSASSILLRLLGLFPLSVQLVRFSLMYRFAFLCCLLASTLSVIMTSSFRYAPAEDQHVFASHVDDILAIGTLLSFLAAFWKSKALQDSSWLLESYLSRAGRLDEAKHKSHLELGFMLLIWSLCVASRFYSKALALNLNDFGFALNVFVLLAISFHALRLCHCLVYMVDHFCNWMQDNSDFEGALQEFFLLHCTIRTACASMQWCFVVLQLTATVIFLFGSATIYFGHVAVDWVLETLFPGLLCEVALLYLSLRAGLVSDLCARVPMLVNSTTAKLEIKRMYVIDYIVHCKAGFYILEMRLSTASLLKLCYIAFVAWCGLLTKGLFT